MVVERSPVPATLVALLLGLLLGAAACAPVEEPAEQIAATDAFDVANLTRTDPPVAPGAMAPQLSPAADGGVWLSWLEPRSGDGGEGHRFRLAHYDGAAWGDPRTIAEGDDFFANWADVPSVVEGEAAAGGTGELLAHWLAKTGDDTYAYGVFLARSTDGGATWAPLGTVHDDTTPTEHGFVSLLAAPGGGFDAFWLDGRGMMDGGPMTLRAAHLPDAPARAGSGASATSVVARAVLDDRVCECCQTSATRTARGPLVVYRDRSEGEIRDIRAVAHTGGADGDAWSAPRPVAEDGWNISGCPVNGPAVAARGDSVVVAWFTAADRRPRVQAAFSSDGGVSFGPAAEIDAAGMLHAQAPLGRVDVALTDYRQRMDRGPQGDGGQDSDGHTSAVVSWLGGDGGVWLRRVSADGVTHPAHRVARTATERASGFPRIERFVASPEAGSSADRERLAVAWVEPGSPEPSSSDTDSSETGVAATGSPGTVRFATLDVADLAGLPDTAPSAGSPP